MASLLTLDLPEEVESALQEEAAREGKTPEELAIDWIASRVAKPPRGSAEALMESCGTWSMTVEERERIEREIEENRLVGEETPS